MRTIVDGGLICTAMAIVGSCIDTIFDWLFCSPTGQAIGLVSLFVAVVLGFRNQAQSDRYGDGI